jgi:hypothetical protein
MNGAMAPELLSKLWLPFVGATVVIWLAALWLIAHLGGWVSLASVYPAHTAPAGDRFRHQSVQVNNWLGYNGAVNFVAGIAGLHLTVFVLFRPFHSPIQVPWQEIRATRTRVWWFIPAVRLTFARAPAVRLHVAEPLFSKLSQASQGQLTLSDAA